MINLAEGIEERAIERTRKELAEKAEKEIIKAVREARIEATRKVKEDVALNMHELGYTVNQISEVVELSDDDIKAIIDQHCLN